MPENVDSDAEVVAAPSPTRQCGRCRLTFEGDPSLDPIAQEKWWLCPACRAILLPNRRNPAFRDRPTIATHAP